MLEQGARLSTAKQNLFEQFARIGKAVSSAARLQLLDLLAQGEKPVDLLARQTGLAVTNASNHLKELRHAGLVATRKDGSYVYYRLADPAVHTFLRSLQDIARLQLADVRQLVQEYYEEPDALEPLAAPELLARMRAKDVIVLDVRPADEYASGHIPGAVSIPIDELQRRLSELPRKKEIVAYCRGPYCVFALQATGILRASGYRARRLSEGLPDWREAGHGVAVGAGAEESMRKTRKGRRG